MKKLLSLLLALAMALTLAACSGPGPSAESQPPASEPAQSPSAQPTESAELAGDPDAPAPELFLNTGGGITLTGPDDTFQVEVTVDRGEIVELIYGCEDDFVAECSPDGLVFAVQPGSTVLGVWATVEDGEEGGRYDLYTECPVTCDWEAEPSGSPGAAPSEALAERSIILSHSDVTLKAVGSSFRLSVVRNGIPADATVDVKFGSSDESVATVDQDGMVTCVGPGRATITATATAMVDGSAQAWTPSCIVRCRVAAEPAPSPSDEMCGLPLAPSSSPEPTPAPAPTPEPSEEPAPSPSVPPIFAGGLGPGESPDPSGSTPPEEATPLQPAPAGSADLAAFYDQIAAGYADDMPAMMAVGDEYVRNDYPGLLSIPCYQRLVCQPMMTGVACEIVLVQVRNEPDTAVVRTILQDRIDAQAGGGAWYPATMEQWEQNSRIAVHGGYVMLVVHPQADAIVDDFNALF